MPHINIKCYPIELSDDERSTLVATITESIAETFKCDKGVISIALEPVGKDEWQERVYRPEIIERTELLLKKPNY